MLIPSGNDFNSAIQTVTIIAGTNNSIVNIPVTDDDIVEGDEIFSMSLTVPSSLGPGIIIGTITSAIVTIIDTTGKYYHCSDSSVSYLVMYVHLVIRVRFESNQYIGLEASGFLLVTLELFRGSTAYPFNVSVTLSEQSPVSAQGISRMCIIMCGL